MADKIVSDLTALSAPAVGDLVHVVDVSDTTDSVGGTSKKSTLQVLADWLGSLTQTLTNKTLTSPKINENVVLTSTATELNYVNGVTSAIQTQINTKAPTLDPTFTGTVTAPKQQGSASAATFGQFIGVKDLGTVGATETVSWANGDRQKMTLDENLTITFSNAAEGQTLTLYMLQDGSGTNTITFADTINWSDATTPTWTTTAAKWNVAVITYVGGAYLGVGNKFV